MAPLLVQGRAAAKVACQVAGCQVAVLQVAVLHVAAPQSRKLTEALPKAFTGCSCRRLINQDYQDFPQALCPKERLAGVDSQGMAAVGTLSRG
jgi:hypothetical protein